MSKKPNLDSFFEKAEKDATKHTSTRLKKGYKKPAPILIPGQMLYVEGKVKAETQQTMLLLLPETKARLNRLATGRSNLVLMNYLIHKFLDEVEKMTEPQIVDFNAYLTSKGLDSGEEE